MNQACTHSFIHSSFSGKGLLSAYDVSGTMTLSYSSHVIGEELRYGLGLQPRHTKEIETQVCGPKAQQSFSLSPLGFGLGCSPATADRGASSTFLVLLLLSKPLHLNAFERARAFPHRKIAVRLGFFYAYKNKFKSKNAHFKILN